MQTYFANALVALLMYLADNGSSKISGVSRQNLSTFASAESLMPPMPEIDCTVRCRLLIQDSEANHITNPTSPLGSGGGLEVIHSK